jgi:type IX secretion system PorP/SprF family membrane protein
MKLNSSYRLKGLMIVMIITLISTTNSKAQLSPLGAMYFQNQYLGNPSMAGAQEGLRVNMGYSSQQTSMPGSPKTQIITMGYRVNKVGMGLNLMIDQAGLINRTRVIGTYAYHLPLNGDNGNLRFGLSLGLMKDRLNGDVYSGDQGDLSVARFNERPAYVDGDFGATYEKKSLTVQLAVPNLRSFFRSNDTFNGNFVDQANLFSSLSYKFDLPEQIGGISLEPKLCYRGFTGIDDIIDLGTNVTLLGDKISFMTMYHSSKNVSLGFGSKLNSMFYLNAVYRTGTAAFNGNTNGDFEVNLRVKLSKKESK